MFFSIIMILITILLLAMTITKIMINEERIVTIRVIISEAIAIINVLIM